MKNNNVSNASDKRQQLIQLLAQKKKKELAESKKIKVAAQSAAYPLSYSQQRLWFMDKLQGSSAEYNVQSVFRVRGVLDLEQVEWAIAEIVKRHAILRTNYIETGEGVFQAPAHTFNFKIARHDLTDCDRDTQSVRLAQLVQADLNMPFNLQQDLMIRAMYVHCDAVEPGGVLIFNLHHIACDGWSMDILTKEFFALYQAFDDKAAGEFEPLAIQYTDYACWQKDWLDSDKLEQQLAYWQKQLADVTPVHSLPLDRPRPETKSHEGAKVTQTLSATVGTGLNKLANKLNLTPFMLVHGALALVFARHSRNTDVVIGTPLANRSQPELNNLIGFFVNTLVLRVNTDHARLSDYFEHVRQTHIAGQANQDVPFDQLIESLNIPRTLSHHPLVEIVMTFDSAGPASESICVGDVEFEYMPGNFTLAQSDFEIDVRLNEAGVDVNWTYDKALFSSERVAQLNAHYCHVLSQLALLADAAQIDAVELNAVTLSSQDETEYLLTAHNQTQAEVPATKCIHQLFEQQVKLTPNNLAAQHQHSEISYRTLNEKANRFADCLINMEIGAGDYIGIYLNNSIEMLIAVLGVLKSGAAYVALDPSNPAARIKSIMQDTDLELVVLTSDLLADFSIKGADILLMDEALTDADWFDEYDTHDPQQTQDPAETAYVLYTSGSTGKPKGVVVSHANVVNYLDYAAKQYLEAELLGAVVTTPLSFDATITSLLTPLCKGKTVALLAPLKEDLTPVLNYLTSTQPWLFKLTPAHLNLLNFRLVEHQAVDTRHVMVLGGEKLPVACVHQWKTAFFPRAVFINEYGPTEATVGCSVFRVEALGDLDLSRDSVPIGKPIQNAQLYVLDGDARLAPKFAVGELYIGGDGLADKYLGQATLTAQRFIQNPYFDPSDPNSSERLYKTGDLVRYLADENLEFIGRIDEQVKVRGYRIELGEIEHHINQIATVDSAVVSVKGKETGDEKLVAYIRLADPVQGESEQAQQLKAIKQAVSQQLPDYMTPSAFVVIDSWPVTSNGKLNRAALPEPDGAILQGQYHAPETELERQLVALWADVLKLAPQTLSATANFFDLGGHSLLVIKMITAVRAQFGVELTVKSVFDHQELRQLAAFIEKSAPIDQRPEITRIDRDSGPLPLSFAQQRLWFIDQLQGGSPEYNMPMAFEVDAQFDADAAELALIRVIARHEPLRTVFSEGADGAYQDVRHDFNFTLERVDLRHLDAAAQQQEIERALREDSEQAFDLSRDLMVRARYLMCSERRSILMFNMHHIASDGWSLGILAEEFVLQYQAARAGQADPLPALAVQYADFAHWQRLYLSGEKLKTQEEYWRKQLAGVPAMHSLPLSRPRPQHSSNECGLLSKPLAPALVEAIEACAAANKMTPFMLMHSALALVLSRHSNNKDIVIGTPVANRLQAELEPLIGFFVNTLVLRVNTGHGDVAGYLAHVRDVHLGAQANQDIPFEQVVELSNLPRNTQHTPLFQIMFSMDLSTESDVQHRDAGLTPLNTQNSGVQFDLDITLSQTNGHMQLTWMYDRDLFDKVYIQSLHTHLETLLEGLSSQQNTSLGAVNMLPKAEVAQLTKMSASAWVAYPQDVQIHHLIEHYAQSTPDATAVVFEQDRLSYRQLNERANQLARLICQCCDQPQGVTKDTLVALYLEKSTDMVISMLAVLKSGAAYVPISTDYPVERVQFILRDTAAPLLITHNRYALEELAPGLVLPEVLYLDSSQSLQELDKANLALDIEHSALAYVNYTSGTTGQPKGVMVEHQHIAGRYFAWQQAYRLKDQPGVHLQMAGFGFDVCTGDFVRALCSGGCLVLCAKDCLLDPERLWGLMLEHEVNFAEFVPATLLSLCNYLNEVALPFPPLTHLVVGSDSWNMDDHSRVQQILPADCRLINSYGLTECTVDSSYFVSEQQVEPGAKANIGVAFDNVHLYVLNEAMQLAPLGVEGELYVGGVGVARGYLNRPELTEKAFLANALCSDEGVLSLCPTLYKTGDLVKRNAQGQLELIGRKDEQVKIRGHRVELGEIEQTLLGSNKVQSCVVKVQGDERGHKHLVAYIRPAHNPAFDQAQCSKALKHQLSQVLPDYMTPTFYVFVEQWPLSPNGKIDKAALPATSLDLTTQTYIAPVGEVEQKLTQIWSNVLGLAPAQISTASNFFELGGHSLLIMKLATEIQLQFSNKMSVKSLFLMNSLSEMADEIERLEAIRLLDSKIEASADVEEFSF
ncbi:non-ribosomal peptide synthetase [Pseudoalteromonas rubra]|uniref:Carrier domain-containing protein n=1 Tax=Pseudoalteromonas rubra TaxID=43658 RepID=A0A0F4QX14_9GAMM|nr:non-ribosomal peptide synthetase [Pseudoalteromonas rubra]KJZ11132.1 hypothetical protein TW77_06315 [Pseudoalteromonas rubra]